MRALRTLATAALIGWAYLEWGEAGGRAVRRQQRRFSAWRNQPKPGPWWMRSRAGMVRVFRFFFHE